MCAKLICLTGLPAAGKSTLAKELLAKNGNFVRLNKDLLREMLHFNVWTGRNEGMTKDAECVLAKYFLSQNINVIVDDTNLREQDKQSWSQLAKECNAKFEHTILDTSMEECLNRNPKRDKPVPTHVIVQMAMSCQKFPQPAKPFIICDIDGTVADITHRLHFIKHSKETCALAETDACIFKKDWKAFFEAAKDDIPRYEVIEHLREYARAGYKIIFVSGRPEKYRDSTIKWLSTNVLDGIEDSFVTLYMRRDHDKQDDDIVKSNIYETYLKHYPIEAVFDDRPNVIKKWREKGLTVIDVGFGIEF